MATAHSGCQLPQQAASPLLVEVSRHNEGGACKSPMRQQIPITVVTTTCPPAYKRAQAVTRTCSTLARHLTGTSAQQVLRHRSSAYASRAREKARASVTCSWSFFTRNRTGELYSQELTIRISSDYGRHVHANTMAIPPQTHAIR